MKPKERPAADAVPAQKRRDGLGEVRLDGQSIAEKGVNPRPRIGRSNLAEHPSEQQPEKEKHVISAHIHSMFTRHPLLFGLILGYLLRTFTRLLFGF